MDVDLGLPLIPDRAISGEITGIVGGGGGGGQPPGRVGGGGEEAARTGVQMVESLPTEWTDEKHSLYLNSMEELFVNQLYSHEYSSNDFLGWVSRTPKDTNSFKSGGNRLCSGQFKVLRRGCWENVKFDRPRFRKDIENETRVLSANPWIQHFRSTCNDKRLDLCSSDLRGTDELPSQAINLGSLEHVIADCGEGTSSRQSPVCCADMYPPDSVGSREEVSDQNFVDRDGEEANQPSRVYRKKRTRTAVSNAKDQVVPFGKSHVESSSDENCAALIGKDKRYGSAKTAKL